MLGMQEVILILAILLLVFGPDKLPRLAKELGKVINEFRKASSGITEALTAPEIAPNPIESGVGEKKAIIDIATKFGVSTDGKPLEKILQEIATEIENKEKNNKLLKAR